MFPLWPQVKATLTVSQGSHRTDSALGSVVLVLDTVRCCYWNPTDFHGVLELFRLEKTSKIAKCYLP